MSTKNEAVDADRRRLFGMAAAAMAAGQLGIGAAAQARSVAAKPDPGSPMTNATLGAPRQIDAGLLAAASMGATSA